MLSANLNYDGFGLFESFVAIYLMAFLTDIIRLRSKSRFSNNRKFDPPPAALPVQKFLNITEEP